MTVRVAVVDDQALVRAGLTGVLAHAPDLEVVGEAADGDQALELVAREQPDVVLMDIRMPRRDGLSATREVVRRHPATRVVVLTTFDADEYVYEALRSGASGFLLKDERPESLVEAVRAVHSGHTLVTPSVTRRLVAQWVAPRVVPALELLTPREREVLVLVAGGATNGEIATALVVEESTVKTHMNRLLTKLSARDRVQLVILAHEAGLGRPVM